MNHLERLQNAVANLRQGKAELRALNERIRQEAQRISADGSRTDGWKTDEVRRLRERASEHAAAVMGERDTGNSYGKGVTKALDTIATAKAAWASRDGFLRRLLLTRSEPADAFRLQLLSRSPLAELAEIAKAAALAKDTALLALVQNEAAARADDRADDHARRAYNAVQQIVASAPLPEFDRAQALLAEAAELGPIERVRA